eukprot:scpid107699/ scgid32173/ 
MFVREEVKGHEWHDLNALVLQVLKKRARAAATSFVPKRTLQHLVDFRLKDSKYSEKLSDFSRFRRICFGECLATTRYFVLHVVEAWMHSLWHRDIHRSACACHASTYISVADRSSSIFRTIFLKFRTADEGVIFGKNPEGCQHCSLSRLFLHQLLLLLLL